VITTPTLGNVVKERSKTESPGLVERRGQLATKGVFVSMLREKESPQISHDGEDVLIDRIDMKKVMLHSADNAPELWQIPSKHRPLIHQAQASRDARRHLHKAHEEGAVFGVSAESRIDASPGPPNRP
jgi:hypothetical protein